MANVVYGPFTQVPVTNGVTAMNATWGNNAQLQASIALNGLNADLTGPFVLSGITCTKDGSVANQLDIAGGIAYAVMSDATIARILVLADNTHTTSTPSTTYHLYLQPDGTWYWSTSNSPAANSLAICNVATDGSGNISSVTDLRHKVGSPGLPVRLGGLIDTNVTVTTDQLLVTVTPAVNCLVRVSFGLYITNGGSATKPTAYANYTDPHVSPTSFTKAYFTMASSAAAGQLMNGSQATACGNNQAVATYPVTFWAQGGVGIGLHFQDPGGTPNDFVTFTVERIS